MVVRHAILLNAKMETVRLGGCNRAVRTVLSMQKMLLVILNKIDSE